ncbi:hypothetical protein NC651_037960 [Populus alba x Populus x berolinensis]|nr:hypothetical protein NC651_037960 [Populus alba x Populus x berolinensis]
MPLQAGECWRWKKRRGAGGRERRGRCFRAWVAAFGFSPRAERAETRDGGWKLDTAGDFEGRTMEQGRVTIQSGFWPINPPSYAAATPSNPEHRTSLVRAAYILKPSINKMDSGLLTEPSKVGKAQPISDDPRMSILTPEWGR